MKPIVTDIDIDVPNREKILRLFSHTPASNKNKAHNTGVYFHKIPTDPLTGRCSIDYQEAETLGYFKIDVLNVSIYTGIRDEDHMNSLLAHEPLWELLEEEEFCNMVFHMRGHHDICKIMKPCNLEQLAAVLAMIRPAKRNLVGKDWNYVMKHVWTKSTDGAYYWKKSHAMSYAMATILHMNLLTEQISNGATFHKTNMS